MKNAFLYLAVAAIGTAAPAMAQLQHRQEPPARPASLLSTKKEKAKKLHDAIFSQLTGTGNSVAALKTTTTTTDERLIAQSSYAKNDTDGSGTLVWMISDSSDYHYSGEHRSWFNYNNMSYVNYYSLSAYQPMGQGQLFGMRDKDYKPEVQCDSSHTYYPFSSYNLELYMTTRSLFDGAGNINDYSMIYPSFSETDRYLNTFNASNRLTSYTYLQDVSGSFDTVERRALGYTAELLTSDSSQYNSGTSWDPSSSFQYTYDGSGKATRMSLFSYDGSIWYEGYRYDLQYTAGGNIEKMVTYYAASAADTLALDEVDSIGWTPGVSYYTYLGSKYYYMGGIDQQYLIKKHVSTTTGLPDTTYTQAFGATTADTFYDGMTSYVYDTYRNPVTATEYSRSSSSSPTYDTLNRVNHYYYENYTRDNTGVTNVSNATGGFKLYPNPANDNVFIAQGSSTATLAAIKLYDITGRMVTSIPAATYGNTAISMSALPQGTYMVLLVDAQGNILQREKVIKL